MPLPYPHNIDARVRDLLNRIAAANHGPFVSFVLDMHRRGGQTNGSADPRIDINVVTPSARFLDALALSVDHVERVADHVVNRCPDCDDALVAGETCPRPECIAERAAAEMPVDLPALIDGSLGTARDFRIGAFHIEWRPERTHEERWTVHHKGGYYGGFRGRRNAIEEVLAFDTDLGPADVEVTR